mmetsp:Transcript_21113/g.25955  ORF Transcript_21113/g.25955 Transcript_21113/m.25955 type:complete len:103 (+) Transcript_21113:196-504(+)
MRHIERAKEESKNEYEEIAGTRIFELQQVITQRMEEAAKLSKSSNVPHTMDDRAFEFIKGNVLTTPFTNIQKSKFEVSTNKECLKSKSNIDMIPVILPQTLT